MASLVSVRIGDSKIWHGAWESFTWQDGSSYEFACKRAQKAHGGRAVHERANTVYDGHHRVTCAHCRKALGMEPLPKKSKPKYKPSELTETEFAVAYDYMLEQLHDPEEIKEKRSTLWEKPFITFAHTKYIKHLQELMAKYVPFYRLVNHVSRRTIYYRSMFPHEFAFPILEFLGVTQRIKARTQYQNFVQYSDFNICTFGKSSVQQSVLYYTPGSETGHTIVKIRQGEELRLQGVL